MAEENELQQEQALQAQGQAPGQKNAPGSENGDDVIGDETGNAFTAFAGKASSNPSAPPAGGSALGNFTAAGGEDPTEISGSASTEATNTLSMGQSKSQTVSGEQYTGLGEEREGQWDAKIGALNQEKADLEKKLSVPTQQELYDQNYQQRHAQEEERKRKQAMRQAERQAGGEASQEWRDRVAAQKRMDKDAFRNEREDDAESLYERMLADARKDGAEPDEAEKARLKRKAWRQAGSALRKEDRAGRREDREKRKDEIEKQLLDEAMEKAEKEGRELTEEEKRRISTKARTQAAREANQLRANAGLGTREERKNAIEERAEQLYKERIDEMTGEDGVIELDEQAMRQVKRRAHRKAKRDAELQADEGIAALANRYGRKYESEKEYRRKQLLKAIIAGLGDLGGLIARSVTAKNSGIILPFSTLTGGAIRDKKVSDKEREETRKELMALRQAELDKIGKKIEDAEKMRLEEQKEHGYQNVSGTEKNDMGVSVKNSRTNRAEVSSEKEDPKESAWEKEWAKNRARGAVMMSGRSGQDGYTSQHVAVPRETAQSAMNGLYRELGAFSRKFSGSIDDQGNINAGLIGTDGKPFIVANLENLMASITAADEAVDGKLRSTLQQESDVTIRAIENNAKEGFNPNISEEQRKALQEIYERYINYLETHRMMDEDGTESGVPPQSQQGTQGGQHGAASGLL